MGAGVIAARNRRRQGIGAQLDDGTTALGAEERRQGWSNASSLRKVLVLVVAFVKFAYIAWFYAFGVGLNLGDTASYIDESSAAIYFERSGGVGFAYVATILYSNPVLRSFVEVLTIAVICRLVLSLKTDRQAVMATCLLLLPTSLAFMTVASKELLVFLLLCLAYRMSLWIGFPAFVITVALKPPFVVLAAMPLIRRLGFVRIYFLVALLVAAVLLPINSWSDFYRQSFVENSAHFRSGNLTYDGPGAFPYTPILRVVGLDLGGMEPYGIFIGLMVFAVNALILYILVSRYGPFKGAVMYAVFAIAVLPYSVHNLGSTARYQAPLACALILNELLVHARHGKVPFSTRHK